LQEQKKVEGLLAFREEKIALMPSKAGAYTLPAIEIPWFNTKSQKMEIASIPETVINAVAATVADEMPASVAPVAPQKVEASAGIESSKQAITWFWVSVFLGVGWLITVVFFLTKHRFKKTVIENNEADVNLKGCVKTLKNACRNNDAVSAKNALLDWGRQKFNSNNLGTIAVFCDARLRDEIILLNKVLYGKELSQWQGKKLFQAFTENKAREKIADTEDKSLEPLFRL
jgi:hypothetical protein